MERILIVGLGSIGYRHLKIARNLLPHADIRILRHKHSDDLPEEANGAFFNIDDAVKFLPEAAVISNPAPFHMESASALVRIGCNLLIEKPLSNNSNNIDYFLESVRNLNQVILVGYNLRFLAALRHFKKLIKKNAIGKIFSVRSEAGNHLPSWRPGTDYRNNVSAQSALGGGVLLELSHEIDYLRWIFGDIEWVSAWVGKTSDLEIDVEDTANLIIGFKDTDSSICSLNLDFIRHDAVRSCTAIGSDGSLRWNAISGTVEEWNISNYKWDLVFNTEDDLNNSYHEEWRHFIDCINNNKPSLVSLNDGIAALRLVEAAKKSNLKKGLRVYIDNSK